MRIENWSPDVITKEVEGKAMDRLARAGEVVAAKARQYVPVKSGILRDSIRVTRLKGDPKFNIRVYAGNRKKVNGAYYAHMIENGTKNIAAVGFMRKALAASKSYIKSIVENG